MDINEPIIDVFNEEELIEQNESSNEIDTSFETHFMKLEEILRNKSNRENVLKQAAETLQYNKQILNDQSEKLQQKQKENQHLSTKIKYEVQWRDRVVKNMVGTHGKLKTITSATDAVKSVITLSEHDQEQFNQGKQQLLDWFSLTKDENDLKYEQLVQQDNLLSKQVENEKLNMVELKKQFEKENEDVVNKIKSKELKINELKININELKIKNKLSEERICTTSSEIEYIFKELNAEDSNWTTLQQTIQNERMEYDEKIKTLKELIEKNENCIVDLEKNTDQIQFEINTGNTILNKINITKSELDEKISNTEYRRVSYKTEILKLKETLESEMKEYNTKIDALKNEVSEKQKQIVEKTDENLILKENHDALKNEITSLESNKIQLDSFRIRLNDELKDKQVCFNEKETNFEIAIIKLKSDIFQEKNFNKKIEGELEYLTNEIAELNHEYKDEKTKYDDLLNEASTTEINLNLEMHRLNETKHLLETEVEEAKNRMTEVAQKLAEELQQAQNECNVHIMNLEEHTNVYKKETERVHQTNEEKRKQDLEKLEKVDASLELKMSELKMKRQSLEKELANRKEEFGKIREKREREAKQKKEQDFLELAEKEIGNNEISFSPASKKPMISTTRKSTHTTEVLPNLHIPNSKYSSTSFSDSSICSLDNTTLLKRKLKRQKTNLPTHISGDNHQKSLDEIFNSLRDEPLTGVTTVKKPKNKKK